MGGPPMDEVPAPKGRRARPPGFLSPASKAALRPQASAAGRKPASSRAGKGGTPPPVVVDWEAIGEDFNLQSLLANGVDLPTATQMAMVQALERLGAGPKEDPNKKKKKRPVFGLDGGGDGEEDDSGSGSEDGGKFPAMAGSKGAAASIRLRETMRRHPLQFAADMRRQAAEALEEPSLATSSEVMLRYVTEEVPVQNQKAMGYLMYGLAHVHKLLMEDKKGEAELLTLRLIAAGDQTCLDGTWRTGWALCGLSEPAWNRWAQLDLQTLRKTHGASRLLNESWVAVETQRMRDVQYLVKQRPGGGPGEKGAAKKE